MRADMHSYSYTCAIYTAMNTCAWMCDFCSWFSTEDNHQQITSDYDPVYSYNMCSMLYMRTRTRIGAIISGFDKIWKDLLFPFWSRQKKKGEDKYFQLFIWACADLINSSLYIPREKKRTRCLTSLEKKNSFLNQTYWYILILSMLLVCCGANLVLFIIKPRTFFYS